MQHCTCCDTRLNRFKVVVFGSTYCPNCAPLSAVTGVTASMAFGKIDLNDAVVSPFFVLASGVSVGLFDLSELRS